MSRERILVVGAGPVGLLTADLLAGEGIPSVVLERAAGPSSLPRAVHLDDEAQRVLQHLGLRERLDPHLAPVTRYELLDAGGDLLHAFRREGQPLGHPASVLFHQPDLEAVLREAAEANPLIDLAWSHEVVGVEPSTGTVEVDAPDGARRSLRGSAVLGCDGAASTVRRCLGITSTDRGFEQAWLVVDLLIGERPVRLRHPQQRCDPGAPATSVPVGAGRHRLELMVRPGEGEAGVAARLPALLASWGIDREGVEIERQAVYRFHALDADRWRRGRVFLLGDAAHQMPPFFGQGLCSGFRDAANLAWKLAAVLRGSAADALLDTYEAERRPQTVETIRRTALLGQVITGGGRTANLTRRGAAAVLRRLGPLRRAVEDLQPPPLPPGPLVARRRGPGVVGRPLPQPTLRSDGEAVPADELLGRGWALVGWRTEPLTGAEPVACRFWDALGARRLRVDPAGCGVPGGAEDDGGIERWFGRSRGAVAVVRPDRYVLGVAPARDAAALRGLAARVAAFVA